VRIERPELSIDSGFPGRRELWRIPAYLAIVEMAGASDFGGFFGVWSRRSGSIGEAVSQR
jgi:hypothetical protein